MTSDSLILRPPGSISFGLSHLEPPTHSLKPSKISSLRFQLIPVDVFTS